MSRRSIVFLRPGGLYAIHAIVLAVLVVVVVVVIVVLVIIAVVVGVNTSNNNNCILRRHFPEPFPFSNEYFLMLMLFGRHLLP